MIRDRGRPTVWYSHWNNPADRIEQAARNYQIDKWADQPAYVEVMVEKQALEGVLIPVCTELDIRFTANKGYSSSSAMYETAKRFVAAYSADKDCFVLYLGDHDPSALT